MSSLGAFRIVDAPVTGTIPIELGQCSRLKTLEIRGMKRLKGSVPSELGQLTDLGKRKKSSALLLNTALLYSNSDSTETFSLEGTTGLAGSIPSEVCSLRLQQLTRLTVWCQDCSAACPALG